MSAQRGRGWRTLGVIYPQLARRPGEKNFEKLLKNHLTKRKSCAIIYIRKKER